MPERITDQAWRQIVAVAGAKGTRGKVFRMSAFTGRLIAAERGQTYPYPITLYGVPVVLDNCVHDGDIRLEDR